MRARIKGLEIVSVPIWCHCYQETMKWCTLVPGMSEDFPLNGGQPQKGFACSTGLPGRWCELCFLHSPAAQGAQAAAQATEGQMAACWCACLGKLQRFPDMGVVLPWFSLHSTRVRRAHTTSSGVSRDRSAGSKVRNLRRMTDTHCFLVRPIERPGWGTAPTTKGAGACLILDMASGPGLYQALLTQVKCSESNQQLVRHAAQYALKDAVLFAIAANGVLGAKARDLVGRPGKVPFFGPRRRHLRVSFAWGSSC